MRGYALQRIYRLTFDSCTPQTSLVIVHRRRGTCVKEPTQRLRKALSTPVHLFQCELTETFALSLDREPDNLPAGVCHGFWRYKGQLAMTSRSLASLAVDTPAVMRDLQQDGYTIVRLPRNLIVFPS